MKYTRYEYKKHGKFKVLCSIVIIVSVSIASGLYFSKFVFNGKVDINPSKQSVATPNNGEIIVLQFGYYANKENADEAINSIPSKYNSYIADDEGKYRVVIGLYTEEDGLNELDELTSQGINVVKTYFKIPKDNNEEMKMAEIINGFTKISNKLEESEVKSVNTSDYKKWCSEIINTDELSNSEKLKTVSEYINNLPDEIDKKNVNIHLKYFYEMIEKYRV